MEDRNPSQDSRRLEEVQEQMLNLLSEARTILNKYRGNVLLVRAEMYWLPHTLTCLTNKHSYISHSFSMEDTIKDLKEEIDK